MRCRLVAATLRQAFGRARFRLTLIAVLSLVLWLGLFWLLAEGFSFVKEKVVLDPTTRDDIVRKAFGTFYAVLMAMLTLSSGIILFGSLFRSRETAFLLTIPARAERIFLHKFQEATLLSSWAFLLLGSPMLLAYGIIERAPWYYYAMLPAFLVAFVFIPVGIGSILCLAIIHRLPGKQLHVFVAGAALLAVGVLWMVWSLATGPQGDLLTPRWFLEMSGRLAVSEWRLLPSWWLSSGLMEAARTAWTQSVLFLAVTVANALFCRQLAVWTAGRIYRSAYSRLFSKRRVRKRAGIAHSVGHCHVPPMGWIDLAVLWLTRWLPRQMRLLLVKDLRLFRRDPVQWLQFLIFFGLLSLYFLNIRRLSYGIHHVGWVNMVSFLNLSVVGLLMSTFTTRFIFPMISLEGRRFWLLGLLPLRREAILWGKFLFAVGGLLLPCAGLILLSDVMLGMPRISPRIAASHQLTCVILCLGLSGIAVGLGARLPNFREQSPARIAAGFGGTLNLVISTLYILAVVLLTALPSHFYLDALHPHTVHVLARNAPPSRLLQFWLIAGTFGSMLLGVLATVIPLRIGFRAFNRLEF